MALIDYLEKRTLPKSTMDARRMVAQAPLSALIDRVLYYGSVLVLHRCANYDSKYYLKY